MRTKTLLPALGNALAWLLIALASVWTFGALWFDFPIGKNHDFAIIFLLGVSGAFFFGRSRGRAQAFVALLIALIVGWWVSLKPRNDRPWEPDVAQTAWADIDGDTFTFHNVRNFDYQADGTAIPHWETRTVKLSQVTGMDFAINYWGSPWMAHPIVSFQFADAPPLCFSIETRKEVGEGYSAVGGLYRQYELIYIVADERDSIRVRTNYRKGEDIYLYRTTETPDQARAMFMEYVHALNALHTTPRWYNAITSNCTTAIRTQRTADNRRPWDWRILVNGKGDEMLYERAMIETGGLPFAELKQRSLINERSRAADKDPAYSQRIREGLPGK